MWTSLKIVLSFVFGVLVSYYGYVPQFLLEQDYSIYALYLLLILVGLVVGMDQRAWKVVVKAPVSFLYVPVASIVGTFLGVLVVKIVIKDLSVWEVLAIGAGFGYYSLSSILIAQLYSPVLGVVALLSNIFRELITLIFTPVFVKFFGPYSPIAVGGATAMDTTLPIIIHYSGRQYALMAIFSGLSLTLSVPFFVSLFCSLA